MGKIFCILLLWMIVGTAAWALRFDFSFYPDMPIVVTLKQGTSADTLYTGKLDKEGKANIRFSENLFGTGMATVRVANVSFDFIISGEDASIRCPEEHIHGGNVVFENSPENESLQKWFYEQSHRDRNIDLLVHLEQFYDKGNIFYSSIQKEKKSLLSEEKKFQMMLEGSSLYAAEFIRFHNFVNKEIAGLPYADSTQMEEIRKYVKKDLNINSLFSSGLWFATLNGLLTLYNDTSFRKYFISDMFVLLSGADSDRVYTTLSENLFAICETTGWSEHEEQLAGLLINDGRIKEPSGKLKFLMTLYKLNKGSKAPALTQGNLNGGKTLLAFYESGCGSCENEMQQLCGAYSLLEKKGYNVISVSADMDNEVFQHKASIFPWKEKYCDLKGFEGEDFVNYGVIGTPTFYLIDNNGMIKGRYARLADIGLIE